MKIGRKQKENLRKIMQNSMILESSLCCLSMGKLQNSVGFYQAGKNPEAYKGPLKGFCIIFINIYQNIYIDLRMEASHKNMHVKKLYETVLINGVQCQAKKEAVMSIIKLAITDHSHFSFLLNQIDWFSQSNLSLMPLLGKALRAYRGTSKTASKVVYNFLTTALCLPKVNMSVVDLLVNLIHSYKDNIIAIESIRESYPHKVCELDTHINYVEALLKLCQQIPSERFHILEIIVQSLAAFDTEMSLGELYSAKIEFEDETVLDLTEQCGVFEHKYDQILSRVFAFLSKFDQKGKQALLKQFYLIFQKVMMTVDNIKMIQYLAFYLAQASVQNSLSFIAMLMTTIIESLTQKKSKKIFLSSLQFLRSYLCRSTVLPEKMGRKIFLSLISQIQQKLAQLNQSSYADLNLRQFAEQNFYQLYLLESVLFLKWKFPSFCQNDNTRKSYEELMKEAKLKLHYSIFMDRSFLELVDKQELKNNIVNSNNTFSTKYVDRFIPMFLTKSREFIKMKLYLPERRERPAWNLQESTEIQQWGNVQCRKMISGGNTPVTQLNSC